MQYELNQLKLSVNEKIKLLKISGVPKYWYWDCPKLANIFNTFSFIIRKV